VKGSLKPRVTRLIRRVHTFKIRVYAPAILPMLAVYSENFPLKFTFSALNVDSVSLAMEAIGDITASAEVSQLPVVGEEFDTRIQGGILVSIPVQFLGSLINSAI
jgi:hypothetical protein